MCFYTVHMKLSVLSGPQRNLPRPKQSQQQKTYYPPNVGPRGCARRKLHMDDAIWTAPTTLKKVCVVNRQWQVVTEAEVY